MKAILRNVVLVTACAVASAQTFTIPGGPSWPCSPSLSDLPTLMMRARVAFDENAPDTAMNRLADALLRTRSIMVGTRDTVTVLGNTAGARKVRATKYRGSYGTGFQRQTAAGCWISTDALRQPVSIK